jgi:hypothetical protein
MIKEHHTSEGQILLYQTADGKQRIEVRLANDTVWLSQVLLAELFQTTVSNINLHIKNIYAEGELFEEATIKDYLIVRQEGNRKVNRPVKYYNLDMILAIGYRVRSHRGIQFRQWATERLKDYIIKGFALDDERLSKPGGAERQARQRKIMYMADWKTKLDAFLQLNDEKILTHAGKISAEMAKELALTEYAKFEEQRQLGELMHSEEELREALNRVMSNREVVQQDDM